MSRIGKLPISIPTGVTVTLKDNVVTVKGPKGELSQFVDPSINVAIEDGHVMLTENENAMLDNVKQRHAFHGLYRSLVNNMVIGVTTGFERKLVLVGVGYRAQAKGKSVGLALGFSHPIDHELPEGVTAECPTQTEIVLKSADKALLGQVAADIRAYRSPEPYKGKGVRYSDEVVRTKEA